MQCVDAGLDSLGKASNVVYWYLIQKRGLNRDKIPNDPTDFMQALRTLFGQGAEIIERVIVRQIEQVFGVTTRQGGLIEILSAVKARTESEAQNPEEARGSQSVRTSARAVTGRIKRRSAG